MLQVKKIMSKLSSKSQIHRSNDYMFYLVVQMMNVFHLWFYVHKKTEDSLEKRVSRYVTCCLGTPELLKMHFDSCLCSLLCSVHISQLKNKMKNKGDIKLNKASNSQWKIKKKVISRLYFYYRLLLPFTEEGKNELINWHPRLRPFWGILWEDFPASGFDLLF